MTALGSDWSGRWVEPDLEGGARSPLTCWSDPSASVVVDEVLLPRWPVTSANAEVSAHERPRLRRDELARQLDSISGQNWGQEVADP
jgi:hypothetical protein